jgi:hypothetical protein
MRDPIAVGIVRSTLRKQPGETAFMPPCPTCPWDAGPGLLATLQELAQRQRERVGVRPILGFCRIPSPDVGLHD